MDERMTDTSGGAPIGRPPTMSVQASGPGGALGPQTVVLRAGVRQFFLATTRHTRWGQSRRGRIRACVS